MLAVESVSDLKQEIARLRALLDEREEQIRQLQLSMRPKEWGPPIELRLTISEARILAVLYKGKGETVSKERVYFALYNDKLDQPDLKIVDVYVCTARKKLSPYDIHIETIWGKGYRLTPDSITVLKELENPSMRDE